MVHDERSRFMELPNYNEERWKKLKELFAELDGIRTANPLVEVLRRMFAESGNYVDQFKQESSTPDDLLNLDSAVGSSWAFKGLEIFLEELATEEERANFFDAILPFIVFLASSIEMFSPKEGFLLFVQQCESVMAVDKRFIACVLASAFLCCLPPPPPDALVRSLNFNNFFACFHREEIQKTQAAKLRCIIHYFERLSIDWPGIQGRVFYSRQVLPQNSLPDLEDWMSCDLPLCPVVIDSKTALEDSGEHLLQVVFVNDIIGGGVLGGDHFQEEIRFCINPELLLAIMFAEAMQDNECIVVRGIERFSSYAGYGKTFEFASDFKDKSQRDDNGDFLTTVVAMDAKQFKRSHKEAQYEEAAVVRELNKAFVAFFNPVVGSRLIKLISGVKADNEDKEILENEVGWSKEESNMTPSADEMIVEFSNELVNHTLNEAFTAVDANNNAVISEAHEDADDILTPIMKKSLIDVFGRSSEKARTYSENLLSPTPLPKCLERTFSGTDTPVVPSTPPSSPAVWEKEEKSLESHGFHALLSNHSTAFQKSFAESLSNTLKSCFEVTSSLAISIATSAKSPVLAVTDTKESFRKSPRYLGSPVKNGNSIISFMNQSFVDSDLSPSETFSNPVNISEVVEDLSSLVNLFKRDGGCKGYWKQASFNARQNLLVEFDQANNDESNKENSKVYQEASQSDKVVFEEFAMKLSGLVLKSSIGHSVFSMEEEGIEGGECERSAGLLAFQTGQGGKSTRADAPTEEEAETENIHLKTIVEGHVDAVLEKIIATCLPEAAHLTCADEHVEREKEVERKLPPSHTDDQWRWKSTDSAAMSNTNSLPPQFSEEASFSCEELSIVIPEVVIQTAENLAKNIVFAGLSQTSEILQRERRVWMDENEGCRKAESQLEVKEIHNSKQLSFSGALSCFAENLSSLTVSGAVKIACVQFEMQSMKSAARPVAIGNWGCGMSHGDLELKAVIQWVAASAAGCPVVAYHALGDQRISGLLKTVVCLRSRGWKVSDVIHRVIQFCESVRDKEDEAVGQQGFLSFLCQTPQTSL